MFNQVRIQHHTRTTMKQETRTFLLTTVCCLACCLMAKSQNAFVYQGKRMLTESRRLLVNPLTTDKSRYTFPNLREALLYAQQKKGSDTAWTEIYILPSVYWMDDPDDPAVRRPRQGEDTPFAMEVKTNRLRMIGLGKKPDEVVIACNRGQTQGADGNFTMFHFIGNDIEAKNICFGNYCNVDLDYPYDPRLSRKKRKEAIVQAQVAICTGDRYRLENCRFISRLNLCPFVGAKDTRFDRCYFECTDDALCGTGIYNHCRFTLYSSKPFYATDKEHGALLTNCQLHAKTKGTQYLTKVSSPITLVNCQWTSDDPDLRIEWSRRPDPKYRCIMQDCTLNGKPLTLPSPTLPLPTCLPPFALQNQTDIASGQWTLDCHKPTDTADYDWQADNSRSAWGFAEGTDGAEGCWGLVQLQKGARMMLTPADGKGQIRRQTCEVELNPCKGAGQGFGSATGQYLDICIKFDTRLLTGYGLRFIRTPDYDKAVEVMLVEYDRGTISPITKAERCDLFKKGCRVRLTARDSLLTATIENPNCTPACQQLQTVMPHPNGYSGFHLQHTGSTGASATVIGQIRLLDDAPDPIPDVRSTPDSLSLQLKLESERQTHNVP